MCKYLERKEASSHLPFLSEASFSQRLGHLYSYNTDFIRSQLTLQVKHKNKKTKKRKVDKLQNEATYLLSLSSNWGGGAICLVTPSPISIAVLETNVINLLF